MTHATSSTRPTAPSSTSSARRVSPTVASCSERTVPPTPSLASGYAFSSRAAIVLTSSRALATEAPGASRPTTLRYQAPRLLVRKRSSYVIGSQISAPSGWLKPGGAMPTTVRGSRSIWTVRPTSPGSPPKRSSQSLWPSTTTLVPGSFSPATKPRPSTGRARSTSKKAALTSAPSSRVAAPWPVSVTPLGVDRREALERLRLRLDVEEVLGRVDGGLALPDLRHLDQAVGLRERQRAQQHGVHDAEDGARRADPEREREHGHQREARRLPQAPRGVGHVLAQRVEHVHLGPGPVSRSRSSRRASSRCGGRSPRSSPSA